MNIHLRNGLEKLTNSHVLISEERKLKLDKLAALCVKTSHEMGVLRINFICTHNSRRSQIAQLWAWAAAEHFVLNPFECYSGGSEATEFYTNAVEAMRRAGFIIDGQPGENPIYTVHLSGSGQGIRCFSKVYDDAYNPSTDFIAVMVCSDADTNCPVVAGASARFSLPYLDPKWSDGQAEEQTEYDRCAEVIGRELTYLFKVISQHWHSAYTPD
jgi:arsenate reductase (thioredoxin)